MLKIRDLHKTFAGGVRALRGVTLDVPPGMFGLLGPNGAGKTVLMKLLATLLDPDSGTAQMHDIDLVADKQSTRRMIGYLPQEFGLYPTLTAEQTLHYFARLKGVYDRKERGALVGALLEKVNLTSERLQRVGGFSGGMRQRLGIAQALMGNPALLIVDEPTAGLDPEEQARFHNLLAETTNEDTVVLLSTHIVADISGLCSRMAIIRKGEIVASCTPDDAINQLRDSIWEATLTREQAAAVKSNCKALSSQMYNGRVRMRVISPRKCPAEPFTRATPTIADYYLSLVN
jgi:ABC-2 type transport system ATP-binding protein